MSASRRTEVTVDLRIGNISYTGAPLHVPATIDGPGGGGGSGGGAGGGSGLGAGGGTPWSAIAGIIGGRSMYFLMHNITQVARAAMSLSGSVLALIGVAVAGVVAIVANIKIAWAALRVMWDIGKAVLGALWEATVKVAEGFWDVGRAILEGSWTALTEFGGAVAEVMGQALEAIASLVEQSASYFADFEQNITNAVAIMGDFGDAMIVAREKFMDFAEATARRGRYGALAISDAFYQISSAGFAGDESIQDITDAALNFAGATISEIEPAATVLGAALHAFGLEAEWAGTVADIFTQAINKSPLQMQSLTEALRYAMPMSRAFGIDIREMTAVLEAFATVGLSGSMAGTTFRQVLNGLGRVSDKARAEFRALGVDITQFNPRTAGGLIQVVKMFEELEGRIGKRKLADLISRSFEMRAQAGLFALLQTGSEQLEAFEADLYEQGVAARTAAEQLNTLQGAYLQLQNAWENVQVEISRGGLAEGLKQVYLALRAVVLQATDTGIFREFGAVLQGLAGIVVAVVRALSGPLVEAAQTVVRMLPAVVLQLAKAVGKVLPRVIEFIQQIPTLLGKAFTELLPQLLAFGTTIIPLLLDLAETALPLMIDGLRLFIAVLTQFVQENGESLLTWFEAFLQGIVSLLAFLPQLLPAVGDLVLLFVQWAPTLIQFAVSLLPAFLDILTQLVPVLQELAAGALPAMMGMLQGLVAMLGESAVPVLQQWVGLILAFMALVANNWPAIMGMMQLGLALVTVFLNLFGEYLKLLQPKVEGFLKYLKGNWGPVLRTVGMAVKSVLDMLASIAQIIPGLIPLVVLLGTVFELCGTAVMAVITVISVAGGVVAMLLQVIIMGLGAIGKSLWALVHGDLDGVSKAWSDFSASFKNTWAGVQEFIVGSALGTWATLKSIPALWSAGAAGMNIDKVAPVLRRVGGDVNKAMQDAADEYEASGGKAGTKDGASGAFLPPRTSPLGGPGGEMQVAVYNTWQWDPEKTPDQWLREQVVEIQRDGQTIQRLGGGYGAAGVVT